MSNSILSGNVSFVNHDKKYIMIEYEMNGKKKVVNGTVDEKNIIKKHSFQIGDTVSFKVGLSGRGDRMVASDIQFLYNNALDVLVNKARTENNFIGYLKIVEGKYFVKEIDSYLFFPVKFSPWQIKPSETDLNEAVTFELENIDNKNKITASLFTQKFIPEYFSAERAYKKKEIVETEIYKITPHGIYLNIFGNKVQAKISITENNIPAGLKPGDKLKIRISYFNKNKIAVTPVI